MDLLQEFQFELSQFAIGNDQEVSAAAGRIEKTQSAKAIMKSLKRLAAAGIAAGLQLLELRPQPVKKQGLDDLQDVLFGGIMGALGTSLFFVHHRLEKRPENRGRYCVP